MKTNPFPRTVKTKKGSRTIFDEKCACGALRTEHDPSPAGGFGHGPLARTKCRQFTWVAMVEYETLALTHLVNIYSDEDGLWADVDGELVTAKDLPSLMAGVCSAIREAETIAKVTNPEAQS